MTVVLCKGLLCGAQVDIYSVGIILWELVTLMTPARGNLRSVKVPEECPADVAHLIEDCLNANNPDERPTASQIYDRLITRCLPQALLPCCIPHLPSRSYKSPSLGKVIGWDTCSKCSQELLAGCMVSENPDFQGQRTLH